ncbi:hypothetical protein GDO81_022014 [Engystomops pustulosus]|uniref:Uncharacterized protein n=1 Tax=Engystomops pustulosus TaxID=76066 RepID=A0AAV6ZIP1_ENGPU|nr:hypothetical protein GDO81_022014 [Engystomops pustulosus]
MVCRHKSLSLLRSVPRGPDKQRSSTPQSGKASPPLMSDTERFSCTAVWTWLVFNPTDLWNLETGKLQRIVVNPHRLLIICVQDLASILGFAGHST